MATRGVKVEMCSISEQPQDLKIRSEKAGTTAKAVEAKKFNGINKRASVDRCTGT